MAFGAPPLPRPIPQIPRLMSQGEVRPGMVQGQHWSSPVPISEPIPPLRVPEITRGGFLTGRTVTIGGDPYTPRPEWIDTISQLRSISPASHADPRLSNRMER